MPSTSKPRYGSETPRIFTPPLRELKPAVLDAGGFVIEPATSLGFAAIEFSEDVIGWNLFPWQKWLLVHMLELLPDGSFRFRTVIVLVARQSGKSSMSILLSLFWMYVLGKALVIGTAQDLDVAEEIWQGASDIIDETPDLKEQLERVVKVNGKKSIELKSGERYKVKAANRRAGRGLSGDLVLLDELREHQTWDAWAAITKTTIARPDALVLALSNAGDMTSVVLRHLRLMAHTAIGDPDGLSVGQEALEIPDDVDTDDDQLGIFEWSAPVGADVWDRDAWAMANPSLGYSITERTLAAAARTDPEWVFRVECLCQWTDGALIGPFPPGAWDGCLDEKSVATGPLFACVDVAVERSYSYIAIAGRREDDLIHTEIAVARPGTNWVTTWLTEHVDTLGLQGIAFQVRGAPVSALRDEFLYADLPTEELTAPDFASATGIFYDLVRDRKLRHRTQSDLDIPAVTATTRQMSDGAFVWDRRRSDVSALVAATGAVYLAERYQEPPKTPRIFLWDDDIDEEVPA